MEVLFSIMLGVGLASACGFKVFVPFLVISIANLSGNLELAHSFEWIGSYPALIVFGVATLLEIVSYCFPVIDTALDVVSTPVTKYLKSLKTKNLSFNRKKVKYLIKKK